MRNKTLPAVAVAVALVSGGGTTSADIPAWPIRREPASRSSVHLKWSGVPAARRAKRKRRNVLARTSKRKGGAA